MPRKLNEPRRSDLLARNDGVSIMTTNSVSAQRRMEWRREPSSWHRLRTDQHQWEKEGAKAQHNKKGEDGIDGIPCPTTTTTRTAMVASKKEKLQALRVLENDIKVSKEARESWQNGSLKYQTFSLSLPRWRAMRRGKRKRLP